MSTNPNTIKSQDDLIKKAFENQNDDLIKNALNSGYIKSQDDLNPCNSGKRSSDVLIEAISKAERLQKQLAIAVAGLQYYANEDIYIESHKIVNGKNEWTSEVALDNGVKASYFLKKIEEIK